MSDKRKYQAIVAGRRNWKSGQMELVNSHIRTLIQEQEELHRKAWALITVRPDEAAVQEVHTAVNYVDAELRYLYEIREHLATLLRHYKDNTANSIQLAKLIEEHSNGN